MKKIFLACIIICSFFPGAYPLQAQYSTILTFNDFNGIYPEGDVILSGNIVYGMASYGGAYNYGSVFSVYNNGSLYTDLHDFNDTDGATPYGSLTLSGSLLFGMASEGGQHDSGCIFSMHLNGTRYEILHQFSTVTGAYPHGSLLLLGNKLYGMASGGGAHDSGCIFSLDTTGANYKVIHNFTDSNGIPYGSLTSWNGKLFGMTSQGQYDTVVHSSDSLIKDSGSIFSIDTTGSNYKTLHTFKGQDGAYPWGSPIIYKSKLYGMTSRGGLYGKGCAYSIDTDGSKFSTIYYFYGGNGAYPHGSLIYGGYGILYGMTGRGSPNDSGCVFRVDTAGANYKDIFNFNISQGVFPFGSLLLSGKILYGMTEYGGIYNVGLVFKVDTNNNINAGVNELITKSEEVKVYPNPSGGIFNLQIKNYELGMNTNVEIYNMLGAKVYSQSNIQHPTFNIDLSSQSKGIYLYRVVSDEGELLGEGKLVLQ